MGRQIDDQSDQASIETAAAEMQQYTTIAQLDELQQQNIDNIVEWSDILGFVAPALLFVHSHKPLSVIVQHVMILLQPTADLMGFSAVSDTSRLLSHPAGLDLLVVALEQRLSSDHYLANTADNS